MRYCKYVGHFTETEVQLQQMYSKASNHHHHQHHHQQLDF